MTSLYEINMLNQPAVWKKLLDIYILRNLNIDNAQKVIFVGTGSSFWMVRFAEFLWREYYKGNKSTLPLSVQSFDFIKSTYLVSHKDIVVVFSHCGTKTFSIKALEFAKKCGGYYDSRNRNW